MYQYDVDEVFNLVRELGRNANNIDLVLGWGSKQDLYRIKEIVDETIQKSPTFNNEKIWLTEQEKKRIINILSK
jgi:hypothetical protein